MAVDRHEPGALDEGALQVSTWSHEEMRLIWIDFLSVVSLVRDPSVSLFYISETSRTNRLPDRRAVPGTAPPTAPGRARQVLYRADELRRLQDLAAQLSKRGRGFENTMLKRGAMLHGDIAMLAPASERPANGDSAPVLQRLTLYMTDGRQVGLQDAVSHWEMGRWLLDRVRPEGKAPPNKLFPGPESDPVVRLWYLATSAYMQSLMQLDPVHFERELELFPKDPDVLFFAGALHETFASPRIQAALRQMKVPRGVTFDVQSEGAEFRLAEQLYRRALEANPGMVEARIRLGRVLGKRGRQLEALEQLRQAISKTTEPVLQYYCGLFLGAAAEALGHEDEARRSYQRAASLYPMAQSPMLALSRLAAQSGNREAAREGIGQVLTMPAEQDLRNDPWWTYDVSHARNLEMLLADLYRRF